MPAQWKIDSVDKMREWMEKVAIAVSADYSGLDVGAMTALRRVLREKGVQFKVVRNSLAYLAADAAERPLFKDIIEGPTGLAFSFEETVEPAKALAEYIRANRSPLKVKGGIMGDRFLTTAEVVSMATLPPKEVLVSRLMAQLQGPISGLVYTLNAPISGLARVLQRQAEKAGQEETVA